MKRKFIDFEEYSEIVKPFSQWSFGTVSPFPQVSTPKALFVAYAGNISPVSGPSVAMGTLEICRPGESDPVKFNFNQHIFYSTGTISLLEIVETNPQKLAHHWTDDYPTHIQNTAPDWVEDLQNKEI